MKDFTPTKVWPQYVLTLLCKYDEGVKKLCSVIGMRFEDGNGRDLCD